MRGAVLLALWLATPGWADDRQVVGKIFRRPEFQWKSEEKQQPPPVFERPRVASASHGGGADRSGMTEGASSGPTGLVPPEQSDPSESATPGPWDLAPDQTPATGAGSVTPAAPQESEPEPAAATPEPSGNTEPSDPRTGDSEPPGEASPTPTPTPLPESRTENSPAPQSTPSTTPTLPDHPPPPLDYPVEPGLLEKMAIWWSRLLGRPTQDGVRALLLFFRDLAALLLLLAFLRHLLPVLRQLRKWFRAENPAHLVLPDESTPDPEFLPEWQQLWRQASALQNQGRPALAQRMSYLAVLAFLDHSGHIRYQAGATNRDYAAALEAPLREPFLRLTRQFERCRYGGHSPDFEAFRSLCQEVLE